jgi:hypothetical protein
MIRLLDTREQKSPRFLMEAFPDLTTTVLEVGDYFAGGFTDWCTDGVIEKRTYSGNLVEIKIGKDFGIHTEPLERFQDELYRMACYRQKNPHVKLHAIWMTKAHDMRGFKLFHHYCHAYHVWGHILYDEHDVIETLKDLDQPSSYKEFEPYIKRSHEEPTDLARALRVPNGSSSQTAIELSKCTSRMEIDTVKGILKKDGKPSKLCQKINVFLSRLVIFMDMWNETGETR